jgi:transaldolase
VDIYLDSADLQVCREYASRVDGITTNPTLMRAAGVTNYRAHITDLAALGLPLCVETLSLEPDCCLAQARHLFFLGENIVVKVPAADHLIETVAQLSSDEIPLNLTAVCDPHQFSQFALYLNRDAIVSIFAGRIADTGRDPYPFVEQTAAHYRTLWASTREVLNVRHAERAGCAIITLSPALVDKLAMFDMDLNDLARMTIAQFTDDAETLGW